MTNMTVQFRQGITCMRHAQSGRLSGGLSLLMCVVFSLGSSLLLAQGTAQSVESAPDNVPKSTQANLERPAVSLPDSHQMALMLATPELRQSTLLDLAVAAHLVRRAKSEPEKDHGELSRAFLDDRGWLQMLVDRYGWVRPHSSVLDPAAWLVVTELQQQDISDLALVFPGHAPEAVPGYQVFQRGRQRFAAAMLPVYLLGIESKVIPLWDAFLQLTESGESTDPAWKTVESTWFTHRHIPVTPVSGDHPETHELTGEEVSQAISSLVSSVVDARPPDSKGLSKVRYSVLTGEYPVTRPELAELESMPDVDLTGNILYTLSLIDGLQDGLYFEFVRGLLSITSNLLERPLNPGVSFELVDWLVRELPAISAHYAVDFASFDPRLNTAVAAIYAVLLNLSSGQDNDTGGAVIDVKAARVTLADAVAQLTLLIPDMDYYFDTPVRARIAEEINICISIAASLNDGDSPGMTRRQFDACLDTLLQLSDQETRLAELSGNMNGPFTPDTLRRELNVPAWQRINFGVGYLHRRYSTDCQPLAKPLPNPLEWAVLANTLTWFAGHAPELFQTPENEARLSKMRSTGEQLIQNLSEQSECIAGSDLAVNDPVSRSMTEYELVLREFAQGLGAAEKDYRMQILRPGADVSLAQGASQKTAYRPDDLVISPCNREKVCEMTGDLSTTRALIGLFPDEYLVADQTGMGRIDICYRSMEWVERRSELVRADDANVANYFGHLGFDLVGQYVDNDRISDIFRFRFKSPQEHHYLFAQASDDVLNDSCPVEWVGSRVITPLRKQRNGIVPNRLTYLAASRTLPSRLLQSNWDRGAEWRDWFVTGIGVTPQELPPNPDIGNRLNQHLQALYQAEQAEIYQRVLLPNPRNSLGEDVSLFDELSQVSIAKAQIRMQMMLLYPESLINSDKIRMAVTGDMGLLDGRILRRFREDNVSLTSIDGIARERLEQLRENWLKQTVAVRRQGSVPLSLRQAMVRINDLYRQFFTSRPAPLRETEVTKH